MPFPPTPPHLRRQANPLSHDRLLNLCYAYRRLKEHVEGLQQHLDTLAADFRQVYRGRPSTELEEFLTKLALVDAGINMALHADIRLVDLEMIRWEQRSAKLHSESKRQARLRREQDGGDGSDTSADHTARLRKAAIGYNADWPRTPH